MHSEMCLCVSVFSGQADKEFLELAFCAGYWWLASPLLQMTFTTFCVHGVCVFMSVSHRETSRAHVNYKACITVYVCVTAPSLSMSAPPPTHRGESCWWHCPGSGAAEPALGGILCPVGRKAGMVGLPDKGTHTYMSTLHQSDTSKIFFFFNYRLQQFIWYFYFFLPYNYLTASVTLQRFFWKVFAYKTYELIKSDVL